MYNLSLTLAPNNFPDVVYIIEGNKRMSHIQLKRKQNIISYKLI